jgi:peroxiredoxin
MVELGELEAHAGEFARRNLRVVVVSLEDLDEARKTQADFPHLTVAADPERRLIDSLEVLHAGAAPGGKDTAAPTTFLVDGRGTVHWVFRPDRHVHRLSAAQLLAAADEYLKTGT